jgi:hypothetical protein
MGPPIFIDGMGPSIFIDGMGPSICIDGRDLPIFVGGMSGSSLAARCFMSPSSVQRSPAREQDRGA